MGWCGTLLNRRRDGRLYQEFLSISSFQVSEKPGRTHYFGIAQETNGNPHYRNRSANEDLLKSVAGNIAHTFNNLLTPVIGNASLALRDVAEEGQTRRRLRQLLVACDGLAAASSRLLLASGMFPCQKTSIDLRSFLEDTTMSFQSQYCTDYRMELQLPEEEIWASVNPSLLLRLMHELLTNAVEASGCDSRVRISLRCIHHEEGGSEPKSEYAGCLIEVEDCGDGIPAEARARVFEPFFSTKFLGRGFGLTIAANVAEAHGSILNLRPNRGPGTTASLYLPR